MGISNKTRRDGSLSRQAGFTLVEIIVAVAIVGVGTAMAIPAFQRTIANYEVKQTASEITHHLAMVRTKAMTSNQTLNTAITLVNGVVTILTTNNLGAALPFSNNQGIAAPRVAPFIFNLGAIPSGGVISFSSSGLRTSAPGAAGQTIQIGGIAGGAQTDQYLITVAPGGTTMARKM